ncbi:sugar ABC transporter substrate-binding protein [Paenarthrobacter sp. NPDC057981]|uniref:sugar ABC transporter substrate-binding protein n=1 Tax=Paenarthrobacter sp. NPDC057981 TaxID=3346297 RepID=UPI0036DCF389
MQDRKGASALQLGKHIGTVVIAGAMLALSACSAGPTSNTNSPTVGFSAGVLDNPFTAGLVASVVDEANASGLNMLPASNAAGDPGKQVTDVNTLISQGIKGLVTIPRDSDAIIPAIEAANTANIPVVTVDTAANGGKIYMNVRADNVAMGTSVCEQIGKLVGGKGTVLELHGALSTTSGFDRNKGFTDCMTAKYPGVEVIRKDTNWDTAKAVENAQAVLSTTKIDAVFLASDSVMLNGVQTVLENQGKWAPAGQPGHLPLVTIDGSKGSLDAIRSGHVDAVISQPVDLYGKYGVQYLKDAIAGKEYKVGPSDHGSQIVDYKGNLADMLPSPVITKDNVDDRNLWGNK